eukprot:1153088-Pelagomonas_calceolata.AAC.5
MERAPLAVQQHSNLLNCLHSGALQAQVNREVKGKNGKGPRTHLVIKFINLASQMAGDVSTWGSSKASKCVAAEFKALVQTGAMYFMNIQ